MSENHVFIYGLTDPRSGLVRYIGKAKNPQRRLSQHLEPHRLKKRSYKNHWLKELISLNLLPTFVVLERCSVKNWQEREVFWINKFNDSKLTNSTTGGEGGFVLPPEIEAKRVESLKTHYEFFENPFKGKKHTLETRERMSLAKIGKKFSRSAQALENLRNGQKKRRGEIRTEEQRQKIRESLTGYKHTDDTKAKMGERARRQWADPEFRRKMSESRAKSKKE